jgi:hypothetical protein
MSTARCSAVAPACTTSTPFAKASSRLGYLRRQWRLSALHIRLPDIRWFARIPTPVAKCCTSIPILDGTLRCVALCCPMLCAIAAPHNHDFILGSFADSWRMARPWIHTSQTCCSSDSVSCCVVLFACLPVRDLH